MAECPRILEFTGEATVDFIIDAETEITGSAWYKSVNQEIYSTAPNQAYGDIRYKLSEVSSPNTTDNLPANGNVNVAQLRPKNLKSGATVWGP